MGHAAWESLEMELGYRFQDRDLLRRALTHKSRAYEEGTPEVAANNEQLEFLGDSVLGFVVSEWLVRRHPGDPEGQLSKWKHHLVSSSHLHQAAQGMGLGRYLLLGRGEELTGGREKRTLLADAFEALIAAIFLDGGMDAAKSFIMERVLSSTSSAAPVEVEVADYKGKLKELAQARHMPTPYFVVVEERGPLHAKTFVVEARMEHQPTASAEGLSKKSASQRAAKIMLDRLQEQA